MLDLWLGCVALQGTNENNDVHTSVCEIGNCPNKRHVELVQLWRAQVLGFGELELAVYNGPQIACKNDLIKSDLHRLLVLDVPHTTVREHMPLDLEFAKLALYFSHDLFHDVGFTGQLEVVHVFGHTCNEDSSVMPDDELVVHLAWLKTTLECSSAKFD